MSLNTRRGGFDANSKFWNQCGIQLITLRPAGRRRVSRTPLILYTLDTFDMCDADSPRVNWTRPHDLHRVFP